MLSDCLGLLVDTLGPKCSQQNLKALPGSWEERYTSKQVTTKNTAAVGCVEPWWDDLTPLGWKWSREASQGSNISVEARRMGVSCALELRENQAHDGISSSTGSLGSLVGAQAGVPGGKSSEEVGGKKGQLPESPHTGRRPSSWWRHAYLSA